MNKIRRKRLAKIVAQLAALEDHRLQIKEDLEAVLEEEQDALDNMPESLQEGEKGEQMQEYIDAMEGALLDLDLFDIEGIADQLREIAE